MASKKREFPTKKEVIQTLLKEDPRIKKFNRMMLVIEHKKINKDFALIKAELISEGKIALKGSLTCIPDAYEDTFDWNMLKEGQSYFEGYSLDYQGETVGSIIKRGVKKSLSEGKIPYIRK